ncbi:hypothetical protein ACVCJK_002298 [Listeria monocytogenes]
MSVSVSIRISVGVGISVSIGVSISIRISVGIRISVSIGVSVGIPNIRSNKPTSRITIQQINIQKPITSSSSKI